MIFEACKRGLESKELRVNVKKRKTIISGENAGKVTGEGKLPCAACRKCIGSTSIVYNCRRCWLHKKCNGLTGKLKKDSKLKCQTYKNCR